MNEKTKVYLALVEWHDARQAIFDYTDHASSPNPELWSRLGNAEQDLMEIAKELK